MIESIQSVALITCSDSCSKWYIFYIVGIITGSLLEKKVLRKIEKWVLKKRSITHIEGH